MTRTLLSDLVDPEAGSVSARVFSDPGIYRRELEKIFAQCWLFLGHESQIPVVGDFFCTYMAEDPVVLVRQRSGEIGAYLNACRHRGMRVCRADRGNVRAFSCPYHGWTYGLDGRLLGVPREEEAYEERLDKATFGLIPVDRLETYKGLVFGSFAGEGPTLREYLGDATYYLDALLDRRAGGSAVVPGVHKWVIPTNWKLAADNFVGDGYHTATTHLSFLLAARPPGADPSDVKFPPVGQYSLPHGHGGTMFATSEGAEPVIGMGVANAYEEEVARPEMARRLQPVQRRLAANGTIFPNFSFSMNSWCIRVWHPRGPGETEVWNWVLCDADAPPEVIQARKAAAVRTFSPGGLLEQDDGENWSQCTAATRGHIAQTRLRFDYSMAIGKAPEVGSEMPGTVIGSESELAQRRFYEVWLELMKGNAATPTEEDSEW